MYSTICSSNWYKILYIKTTNELSTNYDHVLYASLFTKCFLFIQLKCEVCYSLASLLNYEEIEKQTSTLGTMVFFFDTRFDGILGTAFTASFLHLVCLANILARPNHISKFTF